MSNGPHQLRSQQAGGDHDSALDAVIASLRGRREVLFAAGYGVGSHVSAALRDSGIDVPIDLFGLPREFLGHGSRGQVLDRVVLTPEAITATLLAHVRGCATPVPSDGARLSCLA